MDYYELFISVTKLNANNVSKEFIEFEFWLLQLLGLLSVILEWLAAL